MAKAKVLVVDDDAVWLSLAQAWLKLAGYQAIAHGGSLGTMAAIEATRPDFVLLDVNMPGLAGDVLATLIGRKGMASGPGVVLYSGNDIEETRERARSVGALGAISKLTDRRKFIDELEQCFSRKQV